MPLLTNATSASFSATIPCLRPLSIAIGNCDVLPSAMTFATARVVEQHFPRRDTAAADLPQQHLRDDAAQILREPELHLRAAVGRRLIDDAIDRIGGRVRGNRANHEMARLRRLERQRHDFRRPEVLDDEHVRVLAQRRTRNRQQLVAVAAHLALADERAAVLVHELDLVLERDDVIAPRAIDEIDERGDQRRLSARRSGRRRARAPRLRRTVPESRATGPSCSAEIARAGIMRKMPPAPR